MAAVTVVSKDGMTTYTVLPGRGTVQLIIPDDIAKWVSIRHIGG